MKIEEMSDEEFELFVEEQLKYYDKPYSGLEALMEKYRKDWKTWLEQEDETYTGPLAGE